MKYLILPLLLLLTACIDKDAEEFKRDCPYNLRYGGHYLKVPITISPHQSTYRIGDTLTISTVFPNQIENLSTQQTFTIENLPFKPFSLLYRFYHDYGLKWDAGYRVNELKIDSIYGSGYFTSSKEADAFLAYTVYENEMYHFEMDLILKETGRYILLFSDLYQQGSSAKDEPHQVAVDTITFEGKCPNFRYYICSMIEGDDHIDLFQNELVYLDKEVYGDYFTSIHAEGYNGPYGSGNMLWEFNGTFGFEVVE